MATNQFIGHELYNPSLSSDRARELTLERFGVAGELAPLASYQDQNFRVDSADRSYVLKIANEVFARTDLELQNGAMEHVRGRLSVDVPQPVAAPDGSTIAHADGHDLRLVTYLPGEPLQSFRFLPAVVLRRVGTLAAETVGALASFEWPGVDRMLQWDLRHAREVVDALAPELSDAPHRDLSRQVMDTAQQLLEPLVASLPLQAIHGDIVDWNIICRTDGAGRPTPVGLIDFGDLTYSYRVAELAVTATSCICHHVDAPLEAVREVTQAFNEQTPLTEDETDAVWPLVLARASALAVSAGHQAQLDEGNAYVLETTQYEWLTLELVASVPPSLARAALRQACGMQPHAATRRNAVLLGQLAGGAGPLVRPTGAVAVVDLSPGSDALSRGAWRTREGVRDAIASQAPAATAIGRWAEPRLLHTATDSASQPATVHLGVDVFAPAGTAVLAPWDGTVSRRGEREVLIERDGLLLRVARIVPSTGAPKSVRQGELIGAIAAPGSSDLLPAHVHVQLALEEIDPLPGLGPGTLRDAWLSLCPDPSALVGVDAAARSESAEELLADRTAHVASPQVHYYERPPVIERGWRQHLYDDQARAYLDVVNNIAVVGHSAPAVERAAARQLRLLNTNSRFLYRSMSRFARRLADLFPEPLEVVFLVNSGSEANDLALRLVRHATGARDILCVEGSYHGWTAATFEVSTSLFENPSAEATRPSWVHAIPMPNTFRGPHRGVDAGPRYAAEVDRAIESVTAGGRPLAGMITEPLMGNEGGMVPPPGYTRTAAEMVRAAGGMFIADEVQLGYGRLGHHFWAFEHEGIVPDVVTVAKCAGNGHPLGAVVTTRELADRFGKLASWFSSAGGGPVSCEVGLAVLDVIERERLQDNARRIGDHLRLRLLELAQRYEAIGAVHGMGLYLGLELVRNRDTLEPATSETYAICERMRSLGVIVQPTGNHENILKIKPPLVISQASAEFFVEQLERVLQEGW